MASSGAAIGVLIFLLIAVGAFAYYWFVWRVGEGKSCTPKDEDDVPKGIFTYNDSKECVLSNCETGYTFTSATGGCPPVDNKVDCTFNKIACNSQCTEARYDISPSGTTIGECSQPAPVCEVGDICNDSGSTCQMDGGVLKCNSSTSTT